MTHITDLPPEEMEVIRWQTADSLLSVSMDGTAIEPKEYIGKVGVGLIRYLRQKPVHLLLIHICNSWFF